MLTPRAAIEELHVSVVESRRPSVHAVVRATVSRQMLLETLTECGAHFAALPPCPPGCGCVAHAVRAVLNKESR